MLPRIAENLPKIASICVRHGVKRLDLFGSAARDDFHAGSDLDFFIEFNSYDSPDIADHWFAVQEELQALLHAPVDLVSARTAQNPYFLEVANQHRIMLYAA